MSTLKKLLVVEDEPTSQIILSQLLTPKFQLEVAPNLGRAKILLSKQRPDLILLDFHLPDGDGFDLIHFMKDSEFLAQVPIILLTQESAVQIKVRSFSEGVYDFITKPFEPAELLARIAAHLTRAENIQITDLKSQKVGNLELDVHGQKISLNVGNQLSQLKLSPIEFKILQFLMRHSGRVTSREQLAKGVWQKQFFQSRTIDRHISSIRKKLGPCAPYLQTVSQGGYRLDEIKKAV